VSKRQTSKTFLYVVSTLTVTVTYWSAGIRVLNQYEYITGVFVIRSGDDKT